MKNSTRTTIKLALVFGIMICLLIPQFSIMELIRERSSFKHDAINNVAQQWGSQQHVVGPVLSIPYYEYNAKNEAQKRFAYFMPERLDATSQVDVLELEKSIYKIPVYSSAFIINAEFKSPNFDKWKITEEDILWDQVELIMRVSDPKGILNTPVIQIAATSFDFEPMGRSALGSNSMHVPLTDTVGRSGFKSVIKLAVKGTQSLHFAPLGKSTSYKMTSNWPHPNFQGTYAGFAPVEREVREDGFSATWKATKFNAAYAYEWRDSEIQDQGQFMGVNFFQLADHYTKAERSVKYMLLIVGLVFLSFLLSELLSNLRIHPFQYIMVGAAIVIFYILLLAISEYAGYNWSYLISACATTVLLSGYCSSVFRSRRMVLVEGLLLTTLFIFLFIIINAMQYSLILGAIGLFLILAITMYFTRKIQWYAQDENTGERESAE